MAKMRELERRFERTRTSFPISVLIFWERWFNDDFLRRSQRKLLKERRNKLLNPWNYQYWLKFKFKFLLNIFHKSTPIYPPKIRVNWSGWHVSHITDLHIDHEEPVFRRVFPFEKESQTCTIERCETDPWT